MRILMKYHALFVIFEKAAKFEIFVFCKLYVALYALMPIFVDIAGNLGKNVQQGRQLKKLV